MRDLYEDMHRYFIEVMLDQFDGTAEIIYRMAEDGEEDKLKKALRKMKLDFIKYCADRQIKHPLPPPEDFVVYAFAEGLVAKLNDDMLVDVIYRLLGR